MKKYLFVLSLLISAAALADPIGDANALFAKKSYPEAMQAYTKLANAGNAEAQLPAATCAHEAVVSVR